MRRQYILVEGINLYANIYDTDQLSVIRGSSSLYKKAIDAIKTKFLDQLEAVSTGASSGLFIKITQSTNLIDDIKDFLNSDSNYRHITFAVETCEADDVLVAREHLKRQLRFSQLCGITQAPDYFQSTQQGVNYADELEGSRIAAEGLAFPIRANDNQKSRRLSASVYQRWVHGRLEKQVNSQFSFAPDIQTLCRLPEDNAKTKQYPEITRLNNKMAVFYADGNKFGSRERDYISRAIKTNKDDLNKNDGSQALTAFDNAIQEQRKQFLKDTEKWLSELDGYIGQAALENEQREIRINVDGQYQSIKLNELALRLETLLWGGDEMTLVLPAWLGMAFLQRFFIHNWTLTDSNESFTHAAGIVFCQAKTPIQIVEKLARALADRVKDGFGRDHNGWDYMIMESIDFPENTNIDGFLRDRYADKVPVNTRPKAGKAPQNWDKLNQHLLALCVDRILPKHQLYQLIDALEVDKSPANDSPKDSSGVPKQAPSKSILEMITSSGNKEEQLSPEEQQAKEHEERLTTWAGGEKSSHRENEKKPISWESLSNKHYDKSYRQKHFTPQEQQEYRLLEVLDQKARKALLNEQTGLPFIAKELFGIDDLDDTTQRAWLWIHLAELWDYWLPLEHLSNTSQQEVSNA